MPIFSFLPPMLAVVFNAALWGCAWWPLRELQAGGVHPLWATTLIYLGLVVAIVTVQPSTIDSVLRPRSWPLALAAGVCSGACNWAVVVGDVVREVLLVYLMPVWTLVLACAVLREKACRVMVSCTLVSVSGAAIILLPDGHAAWSLQPGWADWLALTGGAAGALSIVLVRRDGDRASSLGQTLVMFCGSLVTSAGVAFAMSVDGHIPWPDGASASQGVLLGGFATMILLANIAFQYGAARMPAAVTGAVQLTEVLFAATSCAAFGHGIPRAAILLGGALIVAAAIGSLYAHRRNPPRPRREGTRNAELSLTVP